MGDESADVTGVEVSTLHAIGKSIRSRADVGKPAASGLSGGIVAAHETLTKGNPVGRALSTYFDNHILDDSILLGHQLDNGGGNVSNVAATARNSDEEAGVGLKQPVTGSSDIGDRINKNIPSPE